MLRVLLSARVFGNEKTIIVIRYVASVIPITVITTSSVQGFVATRQN